MGEPYEPRVVALNDKSHTPEVVLHRTLNKVKRIKSVVVVIQWDDETFDSDWSGQKTSELALSALHLLRVTQDEAHR